MQISKYCKNKLFEYMFKDNEERVTSDSYDRNLWNLIESAQSGDIVLSSGNNRMSKAIQSILECPYSHSGLIIQSELGCKYVVSSDIYHTMRVWRSHSVLGGRNVILLRCKHQTREWEYINNHVEDQISKYIPYDFRLILDLWRYYKSPVLKTFMSSVHSDDRSKLVCSSQIAIIYEKLGVKLHDYVRSVTPKTFLDSEHFEIVDKVDLSYE